MEKDVRRAFDYCNACQRLKRGRPLDTTAHHEAQGLFPLDCVHIDEFHHGFGLHCDSHDDGSRHTLQYFGRAAIVVGGGDCQCCVHSFVFRVWMEIVSDRAFERTLLQEINERLMILHSMMAQLQTPWRSGCAKTS